MRQLCDMGFEVTATGGITYEDLDILAGLPLYAVDLRPFHPQCGKSGGGGPPHQGPYAGAVDLSASPSKI